MLILRAIFPCLVGFAFAVLPASALRAELPPSVYEARQKAATDHVEIEVLRVEVSPGQEAGQKHIQVLALVNKVIRTTSGTSVGDMINISYDVHDRPAGFVGPGEIPLLTDQQNTQAYLNKIENTENYTPAAGVMSFSNF